MKRLNKFNVITVAFLIISCSLPAQEAARPEGLVNFHGKTEIRPGVVVEGVATGSAAERAGLKKADIILRWSHNEAHGPIDSPFDISPIEMEQGARGNVTLFGLRGNDAYTWNLGPGDWGIKGRPDLSADLLQKYNDGHRQVASAVSAQSTGFWRELAKEAVQSTAPLSGPWVSFHAAELFEQKKEPAEADKFYAWALEQLSEPGARAQVLKNWCFTLAYRSDQVNAEKYCRQAVEESRKSSGDSLTTANYLVFAARLFTNEGALDNARDFLNQALAIQQKLAPDSLPVAETLSRLGTALKQKGEIRQAEDSLKRALAIQQKLTPDTLPVAKSLTELASLQADAGDLGQAEEDYRLATTIARKLAPDGRELASSLEGWGIAASTRGNFAEAMQHYREALAIAEKFGINGLDVGVIVSLMAQVDWARNDLAESEKKFERAVDILKMAGPETSYYTYALLGLGIIQDANGARTQSEKTLREMLAIQLKIGPLHLYAADAMYHLGIIEVAKGNLAQAEEYTLKALKIQQQLIPMGSRTAQTFLGLCDLYLRSGDLDKAKANCSQSLQIYEQISPGSRKTAETIAYLAEIASRNHQPENAAKLYEQALNELEKQMENLGGSEDTRSRFRSLYIDPHFKYIDLLLKDGQISKALDVLERSRARSLLETLSQANVDVNKDADPKLLERKRSLLAKINTKTQARIQLGDKEHSESELGNIDREISDLGKQYDETVENLRAASPSYSSLMQSQILTSTQIQKDLLDQNTVLLEYALNQEHSYVFAVSSGSLKVFELPSQEIIEKAARKVYKALISQTASSNPGFEQEAPRPQKDDYAAIAAELSRMVLMPVAEQIKGKRILIAADGALQYVSFAALPDPNSNNSNSPTPLVVNHEIIGLPSASTLAALRRQEAGRVQPRYSVAVFADPVFDPHDSRVTSSNLSTQDPAKGTKTGQGARNDVDYASLKSNDLLSRSAVDVGLNRNGHAAFPRLLFSRKEAESVLAVTPKGKGKELLDFSANRMAATDPALREYRIVHFATHGLLNSEHPELSGLVLSLVDHAGKPQDGFLQLQDIYNLNLPIDLVVLSACETALGKEISGEGLIGLTRGFMYAGASRVVASLWKVSDVATAQLMAEFYRAMQKHGLSPAAALRSAQVKMLRQKRWHSPYYWAAFQIQGEWK